LNRLIYHITSLDEWNTAQTKIEYQPRQFAVDGFIHCSYLHQLLSVANRIFRGQKNLVVLVIESSKTDSKIIDENLEGGTELYPHLYGLLPINAVKSAIALTGNIDGSFSLPEELKV
jgi:uncharacterized protein (DUF952 family)